MNKIIEAMARAAWEHGSAFQRDAGVHYLGWNELTDLRKQMVRYEIRMTLMVAMECQPTFKMRDAFVKATNDTQNPHCCTEDVWRALLGALLEDDVAVDD
jgi:hypothetical protein